VSSRIHRNIVFPPFDIFLESMPDVSGLPIVIFARQVSALPLSFCRTKTKAIADCAKDLVVQRDKLMSQAK
jgi:hypothetical protein